MRPFQGQLASGAAPMAAALELSTHLSKELSRAYVYASMKSDQDTRDSTYQGLHQEMVQLAAALGAETAFLEPEILRIAPATIARFLSEEPRLGIYKVYLQDIQRRQAHTGTDGEERLLASAAVLANGPGTIYGILSDADFPYPTVTLTDGTPVRLDSASYSIHRASPVREDRALVMSAFFSALGQYRATFGAMLSAQIQSDVFYARARKVRERSGRRPRHAEHPGLGLQTVDRRGQSSPADVSPLPAAAPGDAERAAAPLLRSLCARRRIGRPDLQRGGSAAPHPRVTRPARARGRRPA